MHFCVKIALIFFLPNSGIDGVEIEEFAYDYVELKQDVQQQDVGENENLDTDDGASKLSHTYAKILRQMEEVPEDSYLMHIMNRQGGYLGVIMNSV